MRHIYNLNLKSALCRSFNSKLYTLLIPLSSLLFALITPQSACAQSGLFFPGDQLSNSLLSCVCQDKAGYLWVGTDYGLNRFDGYRFVKYYHNDKDTTSLKHNMVVHLYSDSKGQLWVGSNHGLQRYVYATDAFENYYFEGNVKPRVNDIMELHNGTLLVGTAGYGLFALKDGEHVLKRLNNYSKDSKDVYFSHIYEDTRGVFWRSNANNISWRTKDGRITTFTDDLGTPTDFFDFNGNTVIVCRDNLLTYVNGTMRNDYFDTSELKGTGLELRTAYKDMKGNVYVGTRGNGLFWIPAGTRKLERYKCRVKGVDLNTAKIWAITGDNQGNIWVACQQKGLVLIPNRRPQFSPWRFTDQKIDIGTFVSSVCEGNGGMTWTVVQNQGVYGFDASGHICANPSAPGGASYMYRDSEGLYWLGASKGGYLYDPVSQKSTLVVNYPCDYYNTITEDKNGNIYFSAFGKGFVAYDKSKKTTRVFSMNDKDSGRGRLCNDWIMDLSTDRSGMVWIATSSGVSCYDPFNATFKPFGWNVLLDDVKCNVVCESSLGDIFIGTDEGLYLWRRKSNKVEKTSLRDVMVCYVIEDKSGDIWCSTSNGIWQLLSKDKTWINYVNGSGLYAHEYVCGSGLHTTDDRIFFATADGLTVFTPQQVRDAQTKPGNLMLTGFYLGNRSVNTLTESDFSQVADAPVNEEDYFTVSYMESLITMEFSLLNYADAANTVFEYRFDDSEEWTRTNVGQNSIIFNHLASGTYELHVRAIDNGVVSEEKVYTIHVTSPWYSTTLAWIIYILIFASLVASGFWFYRRQMKLQMDEDKMKFLINATHDIRSPLTLISSPLAKLRDMVKSAENDGVDAESARKTFANMGFELDVIDRNAQRILNLVNQILDVRKIDKQQMHLSCRETDMETFVYNIYKVYEYNAQERGINFTFETEKHGIKAWIDHVQFDKVVSNLLSNAFKYSDDNGEIAVRLSEGHDENAHGLLKDYVEITVADKGIGMKEDVIQHVFDRFYQAKNTTSRGDAGTGIGLNLCKMIVDMHHGSITAANRPDGIQGSVLTVRIPLGCEHLADEEKEIVDATQKAALPKQKHTPRSNHRVLIVDDDEEICNYVSGELGTYYHFSVRHNGKEGLKELLANPYDVVVSDVKMPEMDGFTMLRMIKSNVNISHVPVILLTSQTDAAHRLEGLEKGADAYLTKPFDMDEMHLTIDNLIANHLRLKGKFSGAQSPTDKVETPEIKGNDEQLMERIMKSINAHLSDSDYGVDTMCEEVGISRAHLHRKMKELTGIPVSEFIRNIRLEQAARLLKEQKLNITQVAYTVGFSSHGYFSTVFRKHFGVSPREYVERN